MKKLRGEAILVAVMVCDRDKHECDMIHKDCEEQIANKSDEELSVEQALNGAAISEAVEKEKLVDLLYYDFQAGQPVTELATFKSRYKDAMVMLITESTVSPLEYLRPGASPDSLMLRPLDPATLSRINSEFIGAFLDRFKRMETEESFIVNTRDEKLYIPYPHIYYFEARDKKLFVRTKNMEYAFYGTIESLAKSLPEQFVRCHRSYIVNRQKIIRIVPGDNYIELAEKIGVPMSRGYKSLFAGKQA